MNLSMADGVLYQLPGFLSADEASVLLTNLTHSLAWRQHCLWLFGRERMTPRLCAWYGDADARYAYSGQALEPLPWTALLAGLRQRIETALAWRFNSVLANLYRDGTDSMGWHSDDEASLGSEPVIASLSLGATRRFVLKHRRRADLKMIDIPLASGSLLVMAGPMQSHWRHAVPKTRVAVGKRINLTFRCVVR